MDKGWDEIFEAEAPAPEGEGATLTDDGTAPERESAGALRPLLITREMLAPGVDS